MNRLLLHPRTQLALENIHNAHAMLIIGASGAGKPTVAQEHIKSRMATTSLRDLKHHPYFLHITPTSSTISIDDIRSLQKFLRLKTTGDAETRRAVVLEDAHLLTIEAQNALLKALEEPPADTLIILTASEPLMLRPTVRSRTQQIEILPVSLEGAKKFFDDSETEIEKAHALSGGYVGLMSALLNNESSHELYESVNLAKELLSKPLFERLSRVDELAKDKEKLPILLKSLRLVCEAALKNAALKHDKKLMERWTEKLKALYKSETALNHNPNTKLLLTDLLVSL